MKKSEKILAAEDLTVRFKEAKSIILADYRGLTVAQISTLRGLIKKSGGELMVVKNSIITRALTEAKLPVAPELAGPTAIVIANEDEIAPIKVVADFIKLNTLPSFKSGVFDNKFMSADECTKLAALPSKKELIAKMLGSLTSPAFKMVSTLMGNQQKLVYVLHGLALRNEVTKGGDK